MTIPSDAGIEPTLTAGPRRPSGLRSRRAPRVAGLVAGLLSVAGIPPGCQVTPDEQIADEFFERLQPKDKGWAPVRCRDRAAKVERLRGLVAIALDLRAHLREFETPPPPELLERMQRQPMLGLARDYRCVVQDFTRVDLSTEPDFEDVRDLVANLYVLMGSHLMSQGQLDPGWAHVVEAFELYGRPVGPGVAKQLSLPDVLWSTIRLLDEHPPSGETIDALITVVDATAIRVPVACAALRHELLRLGLLGFRQHFGQREREAVARRYGLDLAMRTWRTPQKHGAHRRAEWIALRDAYDLMVEGCTTRPYGFSLQRAAAPMILMDGLHPPTGIKLRITADWLNRIGLVTDARMSLLARLRSRSLRRSLGRDPTTAELALSFGRRPHNAWDRRGYLFTVHDGQVTVSRGPYQHEVSIAPRVPQPRGRSYAEGRQTPTAP